MGMTGVRVIFVPQVHVLSFPQLAFTSLGKISPNHRALAEAVKARMTAKAQSLSPGLRAQYEIMLDRLDNAVPSCEFLSYGGTPIPTLPATKKVVGLLN